MMDAFSGDILKNWGIDFKRICDDLPISGSPERCLRRFVVEDVKGSLFVFEQISPDQIPRREEIGAALATLSERGLRNLHAYLPTISKGYVLTSGSDVCQLSPYTKDAGLNRFEYMDDAWRGVSLADFLVNLKNAASPGLPLKDGRSFSIFGFIHDLQQKLKEFHPDVFNETADIADFLDNDFRSVHDRAPVMFCHGDFHPLNVIWAENGITAVIDWEFMGLKPEFYDIATMIGCVGVEDPRGLTGGLIRHFLATLDRVSFLSAPIRRRLPEAVIALRFAWLAIWMRNSDLEMIDMETRYLRILYDHLDDLKYSWGCENF